jgi:hypothetical protein
MNIIPFLADTVGTQRPGWFVTTLLLLIMGGGLIAVFRERFRTGGGAGQRTIQLLAVIFLFPTIILLALNGKIGDSTIGTLLGGLVGYLLSGFGKKDCGKKDLPGSSDQSPKPH